MKERCLGCGEELPVPRPAQCPRENCRIVPPAMPEAPKAPVRFGAKDR